MSKSFMSIHRDQQQDLIPNGAPVGSYFKNYTAIDKDIKTLRYTADGPDEQRSLQIKERNYQKLVQCRCDRIDRALRKYRVH